MPFEITKTELVWPGKYDENGKRREPPRVSLPFQVIERVNESRATREAEKRRDLTLFDVWKGDEGDTFDAGWRNKLIWGENALVMSSLMDSFSGKIDLIYIDPPFATGADFSIDVVVGDEGERIHKEQSLVEETAYRDTWGSGTDSYVAMMHERLSIMRDLLAKGGSIYVQCDWRVNSHIRLVLDEVFGKANIVNHIVWHYNRWTGQSRKYQQMHDDIYWYSKTRDSWVYHPQYKEYSLASKEAHRTRGHIQRGSYISKPNEKGVAADDVWDINFPGPSGERIGYPTQKPKKLLERIVQASSNEGGLVADFFAGSGTTLVVAEELNRRWIGCDLGRFAIHTTRKRLLGMEQSRPFEVLNLGRYERQYWRVATFGEDLDQDGSIALYEYVSFILKLYGATAVSGLGSLHGKIGKGVVHVGTVDSPVTIQEIAEAIEECKAAKGTELHVLGWEWEMGVNDLMVEQAKRDGVRLLLRQIPREVMETQAAAKGDVRFFELAYVDFEVKPTRAKREFQVVLNDFAIPNPELVPDEVRAKIKKWSDYVDYWAADWDFRDDTFMQGWVTYRTRKDRSLELKSDPHTFKEPGEYAVMVKVIDIFGNDTSKVVRIQVK